MDKRRAKRHPFKLSLNVLNLYKQDNLKLDDINASIEITDISQLGIGFQTKTRLQVGYYFNASIEVSDVDTLHSVIKIIREDVIDNEKYFYGCEFIAVASILSYLFDNLEDNKEG